MPADQHAFGASFVGRRDNNEDSFRVCEDLGLYLVADGMGGHEGGEVASRVVVDILASFFEAASMQTNPARRAPSGVHRRVRTADATESARVLGEAHSEDRAKGDKSGLRKIMAGAIATAQEEVVRRAVGPLEEMGTTLVAVWITEGVAVVANVGDSRVYRLRGTTLEQLTEDHSFVAELERAGAHDLRAALPESMSAMVTRCLAADANSEPDIQVFPTEPGDVFLLCTDGLTDVMAPEAIASVLTSHEDPSEASKALNTAAYRAGSQDNITSLIVRV